MLDGRELALLSVLLARAGYFIRAVDVHGARYAVDGIARRDAVRAPAVRRRIPPREPAAAPARVAQLWFDVLRAVA